MSKLRPLVDFGLSPAEERVAMWLVQGKMDKQIAFELGISIDTVKFHIDHIYEKIGANPNAGKNRRCHAVAILYRGGR